MDVLLVRPALALYKDEAKRFGTPDRDRRLKTEAHRTMKRITSRRGGHLRDRAVLMMSAWGRGVGTTDMLRSPCKVSRRVENDAPRMRAIRKSF
jgi:hypothetical protein